MNRFSKIVSKVSLLILIFFIIPTNVSAAPVGKFAYVSGRVDILRLQTATVPAKVGDPVYVSDVIRAKSNSRAEITFTNDNIVRIAPNTKVEIREYFSEEAKSSGILNLSRGKVQAIVNEKIAKRIAAFGETNRFEIHTPTAIVGVRGTNFFTFYQRNLTGVLVKWGKVYTYNPKFPDIIVTVTTGNITIIPMNKPAQQPRTATGAEMTGHEKDTAPGEQPRPGRYEGALEPIEDLPVQTPIGPGDLLTDKPTEIRDIPASPPITEILPMGTQSPAPPSELPPPPSLGQ